MTWWRRSQPAAQDPHPPAEDQPLPGEIERERADISAVSILTALALFVAFGLWFYTRDREMVAGDGTIVKQTAGSVTKEAPRPVPLSRRTDRPRSRSSP